MSVHKPTIRRPAVTRSSRPFQAFPADGELPARWPLCEQLLPHALTLADTLRDHEAHATMLVGVLSRASWYPLRAEAGRRALTVTDLTYRDAERLLGTEHHATLNAREHNAMAYGMAGRTRKAIAIFEPLLADRERLLSAEHPDTLTTRHNLANAYQAAGRTAEAIAIFEPLLPDRERILGPEHPDTLTTLHNLATAYQAVGRAADAERLRRPPV